ncbi:MAG: Ig-like domain-containing protein, partial [Spirochaetales bacterium]|nr:Ig-like domain-containing protein [Spirochaetales bacterium]
TDQDTNADLGTYTEEISRAGADKGWTSTAAFTCAEDGSWTFSPSGLKDYEKIKAEKGSGKSYLYTLELYGKSSSGHDSSVSQNVQIDSVLPKIEISSITPTVDEYDGKTGPFVNETITVKGSVTESNLSSVVMKIYSGSELKETKSLGKVYSISEKIDTTKFTDNENLYIEFEAADSVGNIGSCSSKDDSTYSSLKIWQETNRPVITLNNASNSDKTDSEKKTFDFVTDSSKISANNGNLFGTISNNKLTATVSDDDSIVTVAVTVYDKDGKQLSDDKVSSIYGLNPYEFTVNKSTYNLSYYLPSDEGVYKICVDAYDYLKSDTNAKEYGKGTTNPFYIAVSAGAPTISLNSVATYQTSKPSFSGTVSSTQSDVSAAFTSAEINNSALDETALKELSQKLKAAKADDSTSWTVSLKNGESLENGEYSVSFTASNDYGESNSVKTDFTVDSEAPTVKITEYNSIKNETENGFTTEQIFYLNPSNIKTIKGISADTLSGIDSVYYYVGDITGKETPSTEKGWLLANLTKTESEIGWTVSLTDLGNLTEDETYKVHIKATDNAGNASVDYCYISLYIDKTGPKLTASMPDSGLTYTKNEKVYRVYGSNAFSISVTATDVAGVASVSANSTSLVKGDDGIYTGTVSVTPDSDGFASISVVALDSVGNSSETTIDDIMVDSTAPTVAISSYPQNATKDGFTLSGTVSDNLGVESVAVTDSLGPSKSYAAEVSSDGKWSVTLKPSSSAAGADETKDGSHTYTVTAKDKVGNTSTATCRVTTDTTAPYWYTGNTEAKEPYISTKASSEKITVSGVEHSLYNSTSVTVAAKAKDATTNVGHLLYNLNDEKDSSSAVVWKSVDNGNITVENLAQGLNTLKIKAADEAGNETSEAVISFFVDSLAPAEPVLRSVDSDSDKGSMADFAAQNKQKLVNGKEDVTFTLEAADDTSGGENSYSGIASVELAKIGNKTLDKAISGNFVSEENGKKVYSITVPAGELASGSANVTVKDRAGNAATLGMFNFLLDNKAPAVSMSSPAGDVNKTISLSASATDNQEIDGTTLKLEYSADKTAWTELSSVNAGPEYKAVISDSVISVTGFDTTKFADKSTVYVRAVISDKAKNEGMSEAVALRINQDSDRPVVKIDNLARLGDGTFILKYGTNAQITGTLSDDDSTADAVVEEFVISETPYTGSENVKGTTTFDKTTGDFTFEPENTEDGEKTLYFYVKDNGGSEFYTTASTGADSSGNTTYLKNPKLYLKTEQLDDSLAAKVFAYNSDSNSPTVTAGKGVLYSDNAGENAAKDANGETFDFASSNSTLNTSFVAGGSERRFVKFQFEANDASGIEGMTLELFDEANNSVLKLKTPEISASGFTTSGTIEQKQIKPNETDPTTSIWTTEIIDLKGKTTAQYTAKIVPYDKAGLAGNGSYSFFIDNAAPKIVIRSPISGKEVTGTVSIEGTATDTGSSGTANIQWLIPKKEFVTVANTKTGTEKLEYLKSLNWNGGEDALAAKATLTSWKFDFDGKNDDVISAPANFIFKGGNPTLDVYDSGVFATNVTDGIYALPVYFMATDAIGNYSIYTEYALRHNPDGDKPKLDFLYPTVSDYGKDKDGKDLEYVVLGGTIRATGSAVIPSGTTTVRSVYYQIAGENGSFSDSDKTAASTNFGYAVLTAYDVVKEITGTDYSSTSRTIDDSMLKKFGFSTKAEMDAWWGIKANGTAAWNIILNERGELNPKTNGSTTNIKIRTCGINAEGKFGAWTSGDNVISIHIDDKAPVINSIVKQYKDEITSNPAELPAYTASQNYVSDMFLRGQWYLEVTLLDETQVTGYSVQKDTTSLTAGREYYVQSNVEDKSKNGYRLYIPIDKDSDSVSYTITANDAEHTATQTFSFRLDNTAPTLESLTGNGQDLAPNGIIEDSNYVYTVGGKSEDSGSGVERVLFYFMRKSGTTKTTITNEVLLDPMITTGTDDSKIALSTLTELPVKQGEHTFYLYAKEQTSSATKDTFTLTSADSSIRTGGLIYIDGLYRKITKLDGTTVTFEPAMSEAKTSITANFPIAQVIDNTATEKVKSNSANPFTFESGDDGDGMPETFSKTGNTWTWDATIHSYNMPDGPVTLVMLAFDAAGNVNGTSFNLTIANNAPRLAKVWLGTDLNGDGKYTSDSTLEEIVEYNILNAEGIEQKTYTLDFTETVSGKDSTLKYPAGKFTIKNGLAVIPEFTGGNGTIGMIPKLGATDTTATTATTGTVREASASDTTSTNTEKTLGDLTGKFSAQKLTANSKNNSVYGFVMDRDELGSDTEEKGISFTFWDKTEETTQGIDSQYSVLLLKNFVIKQSDSKPPVVRVNPFYWNSASSNSLYENSLKNGHIELEADLPDTFKNSESASKDRDPKVSGKIVFTGTAYDNHGLSSVSFSYGSLSNVVGATYDATNKEWNKTDTLSTDGYEFKVYDAIPENANFKTDTAYFNQSGHKIYWTLAVDTENTNVISTTAAADISLTVLATDSNSNKTNATATTTVDDDASYNKPVYKTDVVPYIVGIKTNLSSLKKNNSSVYDRTALGHYPVSSSETIYVYGFNINGGSLQDSSSNTTSLTKIDATAQKWYSSEYAPSGSVYETGSIKEFKSGKISVIVKDISSLNNENADNSRGNYEKENSTKTGDYSIYQNYYNRQPNNDSNNRLTDDVILDVWEFNSTAARPISGLITDPVMKISPKSGMIGFAFTNSPLYFSMPGTVNRNSRNNNPAGEYSYFYWQGSYDFMSSVALAYDSTGHTYGASAGGDINSSDADRFSFMTDRWGVSGAATGGSYAGNNALRLEAIAQYGDSSGNGPDTLNFNKNRVKSPSYATARSSASTNIYLAYYDDLNEEIRFRYGNLSDSSNKTNFGNFNDAYKSNAVSNQNNLNYGRYSTKYVQVIADADGNCLGNAGEYVSIGVIPAGSTNGQADSDTVVMVWYDSINNKLKYTYNTKPTAGTTGKNKTNWNDAITLLSEAGEYCQLAVDAAGGIHIAAYDGSNADLKYVYIDKYGNAENAKSCTVDSYGILGQNITIDVAYNGTYYEPHIGYYALSSTKPKYARLTSAEISDGVKEDAYTGVWECSIVPTSSRAFQDRINVGVWKDSSGKIKESTKGTSSADQYWGKCYGNGTSNTVLGYAIKKSSSEGYIETAQMR